MEKHISIHRVNRGKAVLISGATKNSDFVNLPPAECVAAVWELTREQWSLTGNKNAELPMQRNVAVLVKPTNEV